MDSAKSYYLLLQAEGWQRECVAQYRSTGDYTALPIHFGNGGAIDAFDMLSVLFDEIPDAQKYQIVISAYTNLRAPATGMGKYLRAIKPLVPASILEPIKDSIDSGGYLTIYRGGAEVKSPALSPSWTLWEDMATWFATRFLWRGDTVVYMGMIKAADVLAYCNNRGEQEIIQYRSVKNIEIASRHYAKDWSEDSAMPNPARVNANEE